MSRMPRMPLALAAGFLALLHAAAFGAGFLAPYGFDEQDREHSYAPPARLHFRDGDGDGDGEGRLHLRPFVHRWVERPGAPGVYAEDRSRAFPVRLLMSAPPGRPGSGVRLFGVDAPARLYLLGTDRFGRDQLSRLLYGARISLFSGLLAAGFAVGLGLLAGAAAGFRGGWLDQVLMRTSELFLALPWLYLLLAVRAVLPLDLAPSGSFLLLVAVLGAVGWARPARLVRGAVLSARSRDYVLAAQGFGASDLYVLRRHVLPQAAGVALTQLALLVPQYLLAEVALSFLGLGVAEPVPSWGTMLAELERYEVLTSYRWLLWPAVLLTGVVLSYHTLAEHIRERLQAGEV
ncbi:MAG TPA: ABC transporter permease [Thermoanaerobaculia bacterium]|nr:ABC transporter permease [Thermoanaerobaculia bacterium]